MTGLVTDEYRRMYAMWRSGAHHTVPDLEKYHRCNLLLHVITQVCCVIRRGGGDKPAAQC